MVSRLYFGRMDETPLKALFSRLFDMCLDKDRLMVDMHMSHMYVPTLLLHSTFVSELIAIRGKVC
jgi:hypothetical protein